MESYSGILTGEELSDFFQVFYTRVTSRDIRVEINPDTTLEHRGEFQVTLTPVDEVFEESLEILFLGRYLNIQGGEEWDKRFTKNTEHSISR